MNKKRYPVKTTVNLLYQEKPRTPVWQIILAVAVFTAVLVVFSKYAVIDRLSASGAALQEAEEFETIVKRMKQTNSDYEDVLREYQHYYFSAADSENGGTYVNCQDVLMVLETEFLNKAGIQMVNLSGNVLTVNLTKINLEGASVIAKSLSQNETVREVKVSAANKAEESEGTTVFLNIILEPAKSGVTQNISAQETKGEE